MILRQKNSFKISYAIIDMRNKQCKVSMETKMPGTQ